MVQNFVSMHVDISQDKLHISTSHGQNCRLVNVISRRCAALAVGKRNVHYSCGIGMHNVHSRVFEGPELGKVGPYETASFLRDEKFEISCFMVRFEELIQILRRNDVFRFPRHKQDVLRESSLVMHFGATCKSYVTYQLIEPNGATKQIFGYFLTSTVLATILILQTWDLGYVIMIFLHSLVGRCKCGALSKNTARIDGMRANSVRNPRFSITNKRLCLKGQWEFQKSQSCPHHHVCYMIAGIQISFRRVPCRISAILIFGEEDLQPFTQYEAMPGKSRRTESCFTAVDTLLVKYSTHAISNRGTSRQQIGVEKEQVRTQNVHVPS